MSTPSGVPALPPSILGYRHVAQMPFYFSQGRLYRIPSSEAECTIFKVDDSNYDGDVIPRFTEHPRGGHLYYSDRDMERLLRRMSWIDLATIGERDWEKRYKKRLLGNNDGRRV